MMQREIENVTLGLLSTARAYPDRPALSVGRSSLTYSNLESIISRIASWLLDNEVNQGDVIALRFSEQIKLVPTLLAVMRIGATGMVLPPTLSREHRLRLLDQAGAKMVISDVDGLLDESLPGLRLPSTSRIESITRSDAISRQPELICSIVVGSGSTGDPKLLPISHRALIRRSEIRQSILNMRLGENLLLLSPAHFSSFFEYSLVPMYCGATSVFWDGRGKITDAIRATRPNTLHLTVFHAQRLISEAHLDSDFNLASIRLVTVSSSPVSDTLREKLIDGLGANLRVIYGSNETGPLTATDLYGSPTSQNSIGRPLEKITLEIVSERGERVPIGRTAQIRVKSPGSISEYFGATARTNFIDGWFYPRDMAQLTEDQEVIFMGRSDHMMIFDGINIYPPQIENALEKHEAVAEAAAFSIPNERHGDVPVCAVTLEDGSSVNAANLTAYAREELGIYAPRRIVILDAIPRNQRGKIDREKLFELATANADPKPSTTETDSLALSYPATQLLRPRQCRVLRRIGVDIRADLSLENLASWEKYIFDPLAPGRYSDVSMGVDGADTIVVEWLRFVQKTTAFLLIQSGIPCFDPILLSKIESRAGKRNVYDLVLEHPQFLNYAPGTISTAIREAFSAANYMCENKANAENREKLWVAIFKRAIPKIAGENIINNSTTRVLYAAYEKGIPFTHKGKGIYQLGWGAASQLISASTTELDSVIGFKIASSKHTTSSVLRQAGLPVPRHYVISSVDEAPAAAEALGYPVVVKPNDLERGEGVTVDVMPTNLNAAVQRALDLSRKKSVLIERQVPGLCHRLFIADGRLLYAVKRLPIGVYGDGRQTVRELVDRAYEADLELPPWERSKIRSIDQLARVALSRENLTSASVPAKGQFAPLRRTETTAEGGVDEDVTDLVHTENVNVAIEAARLSGLSVVGVDIITEDISRPWTETNAIINEVNYSPSLGSAEVSRQHLGEYVDRILRSSGRIPVEVFVGQRSAMKAARSYLRAMKENGVAAFLTNDKMTLNNSEQPHHLTGDTLPARVRALVASKSVEALAIVVQSASILEHPLPLEDVDAVHWIENPFGGGVSKNESIRIAELRDLMDRWQRSEA